MSHGRTHLKLDLHRDIQAISQTKHIFGSVKYLILERVYTGENFIKEKKKKTREPDIRV